jgi:hypothetical protein
MSASPCGRARACHPTSSSEPREPPCSSPLLFVAVTNGAGQYCVGQGVVRLRLVASDGSSASRRAHETGRVAQHRGMPPLTQLGYPGSHPRRRRAVVGEHHLRRAVRPVPRHRHGSPGSIGGRSDSEDRLRATLGGRIGERSPGGRVDRCLVRSRSAQRPMPLAAELLIRQRRPLRDDERLGDAVAKRRVRLRPRRPVVKVGAVDRRPLEVGQRRIAATMPRSRTRASWSEVPCPRSTCTRSADSAGGHRRQHAAIDSAVRLYASSMTTRSAEKPRPEPPDRVTNRSRAPGVKLDRLSAGRRADDPHLLGQQRRAFDQIPHPPEVLGGSLELVRRYAGSAAAARPDRRGTAPRVPAPRGSTPCRSGGEQPARPRTRPTCRRRLPESVAEDQLLPRVEVQTRPVRPARPPRGQPRRRRAGGYEAEAAARRRRRAALRSSMPSDSSTTGRAANSASTAW